jgi:HD-like signal output (HDOD) protein
MGGKRWLKCRTESCKREIPIAELERAELGVTHAEVGAYLLGIWGLPFCSVEAVARHHSPEKTKYLGLSPASTAVLAASLIDQYPLDDDWLSTVGVQQNLDSWHVTLGR